MTKHGARPRVSIQDVATLAGVSTATVSRVVNNQELVASDTSSRVREAIDQLGYQPNRFAKALMTRRSHLLGLAIPDLHGEFYTDILRGADREARNRGYRLMVSSAAMGDDDPFSGSEGFLDGLALMFTEPGQEALKAAAASGIPVVVMDSEDDMTDVDTIRIDNRAGATEATEHLLESRAPDHCYYVGGPPGNYDAQDRAGAFRRALRHAGPIRKDQIVHGSYTADMGRAWADQAHAEGRLIGAGVLAANDEVALGILQAAQTHGVRVPDQLALIGFDDTRLTTIVSPCLSSVRIPREDFGRAAVEAIIRRIEQPDASVRHIRLPTSLVVRASSATIA